MNSHQPTTRKGFTLPEVLVSVSVLVLVIFASTNLVVSIIRSNAENIHTMTAYGLAQEGLEAIRNIRDSNWLLGARFEGTIGPLEQQIWGTSFLDEQYYIVNLAAFQRSPSPVKQIGELTGHTPWILEEISDPEADSDRTLIRKFLDENTGEVQYRHADLLNTQGEETPFHRFIFIESLSDGGAFEKMRVTSVVTWREQARDKEVRLVTDLTDWNKGQL